MFRSSGSNKRKSAGASSVKKLGRACIKQDQGHPFKVWERSGKLCTTHLLPSPWIAIQHSFKKDNLPNGLAQILPSFLTFLVLVGPRNARQGLVKTQNVFVVATKPPEAIKKHVPQVKPPAERRTSGDPGDCRGASRGRENCRYRMGKYDQICKSGWWFGTFFICPYIGNVIIPTDFHIFQRGRSTTNQKWWLQQPYPNNHMKCAPFQLFCPKLLEHTCFPWI